MLFVFTLACGEPDLPVAASPPAPPPAPPAGAVLDPATLAPRLQGAPGALPGLKGDKRRCNYENADAVCRLTSIERLRTDGPRVVLEAVYSVEGSDRETRTQLHIIASREQEALMHYREKPVAKCIIRTPTEPGCGEGRVVVRPEPMNVLPLGIAAPEAPAAPAVAPVE